MSTFVHGIAASENLDSSGEIVSIAGMDISSMELDGVLTYEHELGKMTGEGGKPTDISIKIPSQVVGKVLKVKKIFSEKDCEDDHQLYFWNKCKTPYLYAMGELFDDYTDAARDLAGKFRYDADRKGQQERPVMNFSIEGGKLDKKDNVVTRSVARKLTITVHPCNKAAVAEMVQVDQKKKNDIDELFKAESFIEIELLPFAKSSPIPRHGASTALSGGGVPTSSGGLLGGAGMAKSQPKPHPTQRGMKIGTTTSGKDIYSHGMVGEYDNFNPQDHIEAAGFHNQMEQKSGNNHRAVTHHNNKARLHMAASHSLEKKSNRFGRQAPSATAKKPISGSTSELLAPGKLHDPQLSGKVKYGRKSEDMVKTLTAGSALTSPDKLVGGAALGKESLRKDSANPNWAPKDRKIKDLQAKIDAGTYKPDASKIAGKMLQHPDKPLKKGHPSTETAHSNKSWPQSNPGGSGMGQKGVHHEYDARGQSLAGLAHTSPSEKHHTKNIHREKLQELKDMPKPNLTKDEHEKGVHKPLFSRRTTHTRGVKTGQGMSSMGYNVRNPRDAAVNPKEKSKRNLKQLQAMPKPNLTKSDSIQIPKKDFVQEHKDLLDILDNPTPGKIKREHDKQAKEARKEAGLKHSHKKSESLLRAEYEYANWAKREEFETFMKSRMPHLTKGEIAAIGQAMVLSKSMQMESALANMSPSESQPDSLEKSWKENSRDFASSSHEYHVPNSKARYVLNSFVEAGNKKKTWSLQYHPTGERSDSSEHLGRHHNKDSALKAFKEHKQKKHS